MAERNEGQPSLEGVFRVLSRVPRDRLDRYKDQLSGTRRDQRSARLLHAMVLLTLEQEAEARRSLEALRDDPAAACIYRSRWGSAATSAADAIPPKQEAEVGLAVARIYSLLADEKWCSPPARDEAYRGAIAAFRSSHVGKERLRSLWDEASEKCKRSDDFSSLGGNVGKSPVLGMTSDPVPVPSSWDPQPLRSTGTLTSYVSHLEISQSLTEPFLSLSVHEYGTPEASKLCGGASHCSEHGAQERRSLDSPSGSWSKSGTRFSKRGEEPQSRKTGDFRGSCSSSSAPPDPKAPTEWTDPANATGKPCPEGRSSPTSSMPPLGSTASQGPGEEASSSKKTSSPTPLPSSAPSPPWTGPSSMADASEFFTFVILHASEDEAIACRVKDQLESLGVPNGATYAEDFLIPGRCQLGCFQSALDNSAFTLLLLTENFQSRFCAYQTSVALMDSFTRFRKTNTVIPFVAKERPLKPSEMPMLLAGLVALDENSPVFSKRVKNTFKAGSIQEKKEAWSYRRQVRERRQLQEHQRAMQNLSVLSMNAPAAMPFPPVGFPGPQGPPGHMPQPHFYPAFPAPGASQPPPGPDPPFLLSLGSGGPQPHLIIQNAQMVQIGDYNHMQVEKTNATLGTVEEQGGPENGVENGD